jgi:hypothetical protein
MAVCGITVSGLNQEGIGEVSEPDANPRKTANERAKALNQGEGLDCASQIDTCLVPTYFVKDNEDPAQILTVAIIQNSEIAMTRLVFTCSPAAARRASAPRPRPTPPGPSRGWATRSWVSARPPRWPA